MIEPDDGRGLPALSIVVICFNMARELPRTLRSLAPFYQRGMDARLYEVIVVDNGSAVPPVAGDFAELGLDLRILHSAVRSPSPVAALNQGLAACRGVLIGVLIDGARMASPGLLAAAGAAARLHERPIVYTQSLMLGHRPQWQARFHGYDQAEEDRLIDGIGWPGDGYRLFDIASWPTTETGEARWIAPGYESNALFMPRALWNEVGGYDPAFQSPGGGCASVDLFSRACALPGTQLVVIGGEATFHQYHAGSASSAHLDAPNQLKAFFREYYAVRGRALRPPDKPYWLFQIASPMPQPRRSRHAEKRDTGVAARYVTLLKQVLLNEPALAIEARLRAWEEKAAARPGPDPARVEQLLAKLVRGRDIGLEPPGRLPEALTMIGRRRLDNLAECVTTVIDDGIEGDLVECGVWRGGAALLMAGIVAASGATDRTIWLADSFAGLPPGDPVFDGDIDSDDLNRRGVAVTLDAVKANFARYGLLNDRVRFLPGWFADTLPAAPVDRIAVLRLDGDLYHSTLDALVHLYHKVVPGGFVIIDDYGCVPSCARAVQDFRARSGIAEPIRKIDWTGVYWRKSAHPVTA